MNGYIGFYNGKRVVVMAKTQLEARDEVAKQLKVPPKKQHMISVVLCERADGSQVVHSTGGL